MTRERVASILRDTADGIEAGAIQVGGGDEPIVAAVPPELEVEVEFEREGNVRGLEIELEWAATPVEDETVPEGASIDEEDHIVTAVRPIHRLARFEVFRDRADEWRWRLVHRNGNIIATSGEGYTQKHNAESGLQSVIRNAPGAEVVDEERR